MSKKYLITMTDFEEQSIKDGYTKYKKYCKKLGFTTTISETAYVKEMVKLGVERFIELNNETVM